MNLLRNATLGILICAGLAFSADSAHAQYRRQSNGYSNQRYSGGAYGNAYYQQPLTYSQPHSFYNGGNYGAYGGNHHHQHYCPPVYVSPYPSYYYAPTPSFGIRTGNFSLYIR